MQPDKSKALEITSQIVASRVSGSTSTIDSDSGKKVADYFEEIYNRILKLTEDE